MTQFDFIIVGAGTAGCLLANRLSADPANRVLLIEAGGRDMYPWIHIPVGYLYCIDNPRTDWRLRTEPEAGLNGRSLLYPRGKTLGGCSSINGMIYMRGQARDYDQWAALTGDADWRWDRVLPDFIAHEDHYRRDPGRPTPPDQFTAHHGQGGAWRVDQQRLRWDLLDAFAKAAEQAGIPATDDFNQGDNHGVGYFEVNQKKGWRWNSSKAFLHPVARTRANLTVWTRAQAKRLILDQSEGLRCTGVEVMREGVSVIAHAARSVVLAAGAIGTPHLLLLSGIGPAAHVKDQGITPILDRPGVGANLQDHLQIRAVFKVEGAKTLNKLASTLWGQAGIALQYALTRRGPMSMAPSQLGAFTRSDPGQAHANLQYHVQPLSLDAFGQPLHRFAAFTASVCNLNPTSRGTVTLKAPGFDTPPAIAPRYLSTDEDRRIAAQSLRITRTIVGQPALAPYRPTEYKPGAQYENDADLASLAGDIATTIFHPVGTAKMGMTDDPMAVVDSHLAVIGVAGLRIADASIMPTITSGNTNSPTLMIAEKAARWALAER